MLLRQLKPFTKVWAQPGDGPNNFKVKPKLNKKMNIKFGKEALELAREEDEPRDMQMRFLLSIVVEHLESFRYENPDYLTSV